MPRNTVYPELLGNLERRFSTLEKHSLLPSEQTLADEFGVSKPTLRRALDIMAKAGYLSKINGVGVVLERVPRSISRELVFICHDITFFAKSLNSFGAYATKTNYLISIVPLSGDLLAQERIIETVAERNPAGVIVYADPAIKKTMAFQRLATERITTVYLIRLPDDMDGNLLEFGNADGMTEIVETLYNDGCRKFALYGDGMVNAAAAVERTSGFLNGLRVCRIRPREELLCRPEATPEEREEFIGKLLDPRQRPDAVCCLNDHCAGRLMKILQERGEDLSALKFSGFDNSPLSEFLPQPLLTAEPPMAELGEAAAEMIVRQVENPQFGHQKRKLKAKVLRTRE